MFNPQLPNFNLLMNVWTYPRRPADGAFDFGGIACQHYRQVPVTGTTFTIDESRFPIDAINTYTLGDIYEVPAGSGIYWRTVYLGRRHEGFPNEYWYASIGRTSASGVALTQWTIPTNG